MTWPDNYDIISDARYPFDWIDGIEPGAGTWFAGVYPTPVSYRRFSVDRVFGDIYDLSTGAIVGLSNGGKVVSDTAASVCGILLTHRGSSCIWGYGWSFRGRLLSDDSIPLLQQEIRGALNDLLSRNVISDLQVSVERPKEDQARANVIINYRDRLGKTEQVRI